MIAEVESRDRADGKEPRLPEARPVPLVVELDTLVASNLLLESLFVLAKQRPLRLAMLPLWLARGTASCKHELAREARPDVASLPYDRDLLAFLETEKRRGTSLVLVTGTDEVLAREVADHLGLFDVLLASDGVTNFTGDRKRDWLSHKSGEAGFDYVGSDPRDQPVFEAARKAILVRPRRALAAAVAETTDIERVIEAGGRSTAIEVVRALRPHHWLKNSLVLMPLVAAQRLDEPDLVAMALLAFTALCLAASATYLLNDLMDLPSDRRHPHKKDRPLASGRLSPTLALALVPCLLAASLVLALALPWPFVGVLGLYLVLTLTYTLRLKDLVIVDVLAIASLHSLRVLAGSAAVDIEPSTWLLAFCVFLFFSLAMIKRYAELMVMRSVDGMGAHARAYRLGDSELLAALGGASGLLSVLVLALYISGDTAHILYERYQLIWLVCALLLYWVSYMWLMAHRGVMHDDPLVFALRDRVSRVVVVLMAGVFAVATVG